MFQRGIPRAKHQVAEFTVLGDQWLYSLMLDLKHKDVTLSYSPGDTAYKHSILKNNRKFS